MTRCLSALDSTKHPTEKSSGGYGLEEPRRRGRRPGRGKVKARGQTQEEKRRAVRCGKTEDTRQKPSLHRPRVLLPGEVGGNEQPTLTPQMASEGTQQSVSAQTSRGHSSPHPPHPAGASQPLEGHPVQAHLWLQPAGQKMPGKVFTGLWGRQTDLEAVWTRPAARELGCQWAQRNKVTRVTWNSHSSSGFCPCAFSPLHGGQRGCT